MNNKHLNIVAFDVPFPPNYGGSIDIFYKLKTLHKLNIKIILHCFEYGRGKQNELEKYCEFVYYYKRTTTMKNIVSNLPFTINTRKNIELEINLKSNNYPILFEGLHTTFSLIKNSFEDRTLIIRAHNIEHNYYKGLSKSETNIIKKLYFSSERIKLKTYQKIFKKVNYILSISPLEHTYFSFKYPKKSIYIPAFHEHSEVKSRIGKGKFALYHGNLKISDNLKSKALL